MPVGRSPAERLALKLQGRCGRELKSGMKFTDLRTGDLQFDVSPVSVSSDSGSFEFEVELTEVQSVRYYGARKEMSEVSANILWKALVIVEDDLSIHFANISRFSMDPVSSNEIKEFLSCALRGPDR